MNEVSYRKYNYIRDKQLKRQVERLTLAPSGNLPSLPSWDNSLVIPPRDEKKTANEQQEQNEDREN